MKQTLQQLAEEASSYFETAKRTSNDAEYWRRKDGSPEWVQELCHSAHGDMFPDDHRYEFIVEALSALSENDDPDEIQLEADVYNSDLTEWLHSRNDRSNYCDEVRDEYGDDFRDTMQLIAMGQLREKEEVLSQVREFLENLLEDQEDEDEEEEIEEGTV